MADTHFSETDRVFYSDGYKLGLSVVDGGLTKEALFVAIRTLYAETDNLIQSLVNHAAQHGVNIDCKMGCCFCCHQPVLAISHEIHFLADFINRNFNKNQILEILERARVKNEAFGNVLPEEMQKIKIPCPLLKDGACLVYEARPMACRIYLSQKVASCKEFYEYPENKNNFPALFDFPLRAGQMMNEGFIAALKTQKICSAEYRIEQGLEVGLSTIASDVKQLKDTPLYL